MPESVEGTFAPLPHAAPAGCNIHDPPIACNIPPFTIGLQLSFHEKTVAPRFSYTSRVRVFLFSIMRPNSQISIHMIIRLLRTHDSHSMGTDAIRRLDTRDNQQLHPLITLCVSVYLLALRVIHKTSPGSRPVGSI
jgi:hypothetical protein